MDVEDMPESDLDAGCSAEGDLEGVADVGLRMAPMASRPLTTVHASKSVGRPKPRHAADPAPGWWPDPGLLIADLSMVLFVLLRRVTAAPHVETCFQQTNAVEHRGPQRLWL